MALPPESEYRGVAAAIPQPASRRHISRLQQYISALTFFNPQGPRILYRDPYNNQDITEAVYRWDDRPYTEVFAGGFHARDRVRTSMEDYFNLERHVYYGGAPADTSPAQGSAFVSTTRSTSYRPLVTTEMILYRYEIFAPGGIDVNLTFRGRNAYSNQQEIAFVGGIHSQYIRSVRTYSVVTDGHGGRFPTYTSEGYPVYVNASFNPNPNTYGFTTAEFLGSLRNFRCPRDGQEMVSVSFAGIQKRSADNDDADCNVERFVDCAFNFNDGRGEAYMFTADQCFHVTYAPGTTHDSIKGPMSIVKVFPVLNGTIFATGIDAAFTAKAKNEAYLFKGDKYARFNFVEGRVIGEIKKITEGFHSLKDNIFKDGLDAAFASDRDYEAYIFKGNQYALIDFAPGTVKDRVIGGPKKIIDGFGSFKDENKIFAEGIDAAFSIKGKNEAYIFKGNTYAKINYAPGSKNDKVLWKVTPISDGFRSLKGFIPSYISQLDNCTKAADDEYEVHKVIKEPFVDSSCNIGRFVDCAFNFNNGKEEVFIFTADQCVHINYAPGTRKDWVIKGPMGIGEFFPFLKDTIFDTGIDAAFTAHATNEAYIFRSNMYARINFVSGYMIGEVKLITEGFHSLKNTIFEHGIDAAFASDRPCEAYIFRGDRYTRINFAPGETNDYIVGEGLKKISDGFSSLKNTIFKDGIDAAFSNKGKNEAYIFKGDTYAKIRYVPGIADDEIKWQESPISKGFNSLANIIPWRP